MAMADALRHSLMDWVRAVWAQQAAAPDSDRDLVERFAVHRSEAAVAALFKRHAGMVFQVCRRVLRNTHDAEDACQATFLVYARKAGAIRKRESVGSWLYGVAYRVARSLLARRLREPTCQSTEPPTEKACQ